MESLEPILKDYGLVGFIVVGCVYIIRMIISWLLLRVEDKDKMLEQRHVELIAINHAMLDYINDSKVVTHELIGEMKNLGTSICSRLDKHEVILTGEPHDTPPS